MAGVSDNSRQWIEEIFRAYHFFLLLQVDDNSQIVLQVCPLVIPSVNIISQIGKGSSLIYIYVH